MYREVYKKDNLSVNGLKWITKEPDLDSIKKLDKNFNISNVVKDIISNRNFSSLGIEQYLSPTLRELTPNPMDLHDMDKAIDICYEAILNKHKIGILGDYDVDGASSSALIFNYLRDIGFKNLEVFIPDREKDGYGLSENAVNFFHKKEIKLMICLDCGTNDKNYNS